MLLLREQIGVIHSVIYTHEHATIFSGWTICGSSPTTWGTTCQSTVRKVEDRIRKAYDYAFDDATRHYQAGGLPKLVIERIGTEAIEILGVN